MSYKPDSDLLMHSNGTTAFETLIIIIPSILFAYLSTTIVTFLSCNRIWRFVVESLTLLVPLVLTLTLLSEYAVTIVIVMFLMYTSLVLFIYKYGYVSQNVKDNEEGRIPFITNARATITVLTVIAILAVDFPIFPRKFVKTSTFGYSLMDLGVGLFIFANSIVSPECLNRKDSVLKIVKNSIPLFLIGLLRLVVTKTVDYHVPVAEYGIHWNFFFTLLLTKCISSLIIKLAHVKFMRICSILVLVVHEILLQSTLQNIVMSNNPRINFFLANKEGFSSIMGYVSLYLFAVYFGYIMNQKIYGSLKVTQNLKIFLFYIVITGTLAFFLNKVFGTSRRLMNSAYCLWVVFVGILAASIFYVGEVVQRNAFGKSSNYIKTPYVYTAINFNSLIFFLLGNVLTGIINILWNTWNVNDCTALFILIIYIVTITLILCILYEKRLRLKL